MQMKDSQMVVFRSRLVVLRLRRLILSWLRMGSRELGIILLLRGRGMLSFWKRRLLGEKLKL